ncbi:MAG: site-2 protease family protein [Kiritimatiellia bacterium]|nr:site-2 protease family protein [Lentisphaerota bacterium]
MFDLDAATLIARIGTLLVAFTIHELAHALCADALGDPTPRRMGRISLNPFVHLDPVGTLVLIFAGFGWAKPVMVNPNNMRGDPDRNMAIVSLAGPASNIIMAVLVSILFRLHIAEFTLQNNGAIPTIDFMLSSFLWINVILAVFNLLPIGPLDGLKVLRGILPRSMGGLLDIVERNGMMLLLVMIFLLPMIGIDLFGIVVGRMSVYLVWALIFAGQGIL